MNNPIIKNILAVFAGIAIGTIVNIALVYLGGYLVPPPAGIDPQNAESIKDSIHLFETKHFIFPLLAHALGALSGAFIAVKFSSSKHIGFGLGVSAWFLLGGIVASTMIPSPTWFTTTDLVLCYLPMGFLGWKFAH